MATSFPLRAVSLRARLGIVALVFLGLVLIAAGLSALMFRAWDRNLDQRSDARIVVDEVAELRLAYSDQETGIRGYLLADDPEFLEPYRTGSVLADRLVARLGERAAPRSELAIELADVVEVAATWQNEVALPVLAGSATAVDEDRARDRFEQLRAELDQLDRVVNRDLDRIIRSTERDRNISVGVLVASALTAVAGTALATVLFRRWIIRPVARISAAARALAHDDAADLPDTETPELQEVTDAIRSLQQSLVAARDEALRAFEALEQSAVLALQVRSELADEIGDMPDGWSAQSLLLAAEGLVAGDCFDVGLLDPEHLYIVMIDVTGHGAEAALDALRTKSQLRAALRSRLGPGPALDWLSREHHRDGGGALLTAFVVVVDLPTGVCQYANAGHPPGIVTDGARRRLLPATGPVLGAFPATWRTECAEIGVGELLVVYTDGVTDTLGPDRERFGDHRLHDCLDTADPTEAVAAIRDACTRFGHGRRADDLTVIALRRSTDPTASDTDTVLP